MMIWDRINDFCFKRTLRSQSISEAAVLLEDREMQLYAGENIMRVTKLFATTSMIAGAMAGTPLLAQETEVVEPNADGAAEADSGGVIVVTARKRTERLIDVPESIQVVNAETIERAGINTVNDLGRLTPNVMLNRRQDNEPNVVIRGIGGFGNTQGVGFFIDDVQNFTDQTAGIEDVESIEVLKGPQGTLYGGSNVGGAIRYNLRQPGPDWALDASAEYGSFDTTRLFGALNIPLSENGEFAVRVSGYYNRTDGYISNINIGGRPDASEELGVRFALRWDPSDEFTATLNYRHNELENGGNVYVPAANTRDYRRTVDYNLDVFNDRTVDGFSLHLEATPGDVTFTSLSSYTQRNNRLLWDLDYSALDGVFATEGDRNTTRVYTQELRVTSDTADNFDWLVGGYYARIENRGLVENADVFFGVDFGGPIPIIDFNNGQSTEEQFALFGTANLHFGNFTIGGGLRLGRSEYRGRVLNNPMSITDVNDTFVLPKLTLSYDVGEDLMIYANVARGYEPGRANVVNSSGAPYNEETIWNYELGFKGQTLNRTLSFDIAAFYITYNDRQYENLFLNDQGVPTENITNVGDSESYGLEFGLSYRPSEYFTLNVSGGYLHSVWDDPNAQFNLIAINGNEVPNSPDFSGNISADYRLPIGEDFELGARVDVSHLGNFFWDLPNTSEQSSYQLVNARLSFADADGGWEVAIRAENLFNKGYFNNFVPGFFGPGQSASAPGQPRTVTGSVRFSF